MSDHLDNWLLHSVHETFGDGPPGEVFAEYERLRASAELSENRADVYEECVKRLVAAEARCAAMRTTLYGAHELLRVVVDDLAEFAEGGCGDANYS